MTPNKCKEVNCPRHGIDKNGTDVCILYQVSEVKDDLAVIDVFNVGHKKCRQLRQEVEQWQAQHQDQNMGPIKSVALVRKEAKDE